MQIELGWSLDGAAWGDASAGRAAAGRLRQGPRGLLTLLQGRLGLTHPAVEPVVRTTQYLRLVQQHLAELPDPSDFWPAASMRTDPWSTAALLLRLRDAAVEAGWDAGESADRPGEGAGGSAGVRALPPRLAALAVLEGRVVVGMPGTEDGAGRPATLSPGAADDLREVHAELRALREGGAGWPLGITAITLTEDPSRLPGRWPSLLGELAAAGVAVEVDPSPASSAPALHVVECREEFSAAEVAARLLAADTTPATGTGDSEPGEPAPDSPTTDDAAPGTTVLATSDTSVLDQALRRRGLPPVGLVDRSADRAPQQLLGLFLDVAIAPVDVHQLAALLDLRILPAPEDAAEPVGLVPAAARRRLLRALTQEPGIGGPAWRDALDRLAQDVQEAPAERRGAADRALEAAHALDALVTDPLQPEALTPAALDRRLDWLTARLRAVARGESELTAVLAQTETIREVLALLPPGTPLRRRTLGQIVEACAAGGTSPLSRREVTPWAVTSSPAQLRPGTRVLWWAPGEDGIRPSPRWDPSEVAALAAAGARVPTPEESVALQVEAAGRGLRGAAEVIAVLPGRVREQAPPPSGLLADLEATAGTPRLTPEDLVDGEVWRLAGRSRPLHRPGVPPAGEPAPPRRRIAPGSVAARPERLSFTQLDSLLGCPHHWMLEHRLGVRPAAVAALPTGSRMIGSLVHAVVEQLVGETLDPARGGTPLEAPAAARIGSTFDALVPQLASELDLPGRATERAEIRERAVRSLHTLFARAARAGLRITGSERRFELPLPIPLPDGTTHTATFVGSRDLDARDATGRATVLDLKWSRSRRRYGDLYDTGEAIQLASYAWALGQEDPATDPADPAAPTRAAPADAVTEPAAVGYFLLRSGEFVAADPELDPHRRTPMDTEDTWARALTATGRVLAEIAHGEVRIGCRGLLEDADLPPDAPYPQRHRAVEHARAAARADGGILVEDHCATSDYAQLCGLREDHR